MSTLGVKGKVQETIAQLNAARTDKVRPRDISLRQFVAEKFPKVDGDKPLSLQKFMHEIDVDMNRTTVDQLMEHQDNKFLLPEIIRQGGRVGMGLARRDIAKLGPVVAGAPGGANRFVNPDVYLDTINKGLVQGPFYQDLIIREETVPQKTVTMPFVDLSDATLKDTGEGETIEEGSVTYGDKVVTLQKKARGLKITYEAIRYNTLSLVQIFFQDAGRLLGNTLNGMAVAAIVDGDQDDGSEAAAVIGVEDTDDGITWRDLARVALQGSLIGRDYSQAIGSAAVALDYIDMDEMKRMFFGSAMLPTQLKTPINMPRELYASAAVGANKLVLNDPSASLVQLTSAPLLVEAEKIISKQIEASYMSITTGFGKVQRTASIVIDGSITYTGHEFPTWMAPFAD
jgi:hypothetical protein